MSLADLLRQRHLTAATVLISLLRRYLAAVSHQIYYDTVNLIVVSILS